MAKTMKTMIEELRRLPTETLVKRYQRHWGKPPRIKQREYLWKRIAWKVEEKRTGGLSMLAKARLEELIVELDGTLGLRNASGALREDALELKEASPAPSSAPPAGSTLVRDWKGQRILVRALDSGFEWQGEHYKSLSAVARAVTGAHWNGRLFFGLKKRGASA